MKTKIFLIMLLAFSFGLFAQGDKYLNIDGTLRNYWRIGKNAGQIGWDASKGLYYLKTPSDSGNFILSHADGVQTIDSDLWVRYGKFIVGDTSGKRIELADSIFSVYNSYGLSGTISATNETHAGMNVNSSWLKLISTNQIDVDAPIITFTGNTYFNNDLYPNAIRYAFNIKGGLANKIPYQFAADSTLFINAPDSANQYLKWTGSAFDWTTVTPGALDTTNFLNKQTTFSGDVDGTYNSLVVDSVKFATHYWASQTLEPLISKSTGYAKWTGAAWTFANETYSLSSHNHSGVYEPVITLLDVNKGGTNTYSYTNAKFLIWSDVPGTNGKIESSSYDYSSFATAGHNHSGVYIPVGGESDPTIYAWAKAATKPSYTYGEVGAAASSHNHSASQITSGTMDVSQGGTGAYSYATSGNFLVWTSVPGTNGIFESSSYNAGSFATAAHNHSGVYEPVISKSTGYAKWTGAAWAFANETYSLSSHNHSGVYEPVITTLDVSKGGTNNYNYTSGEFLVWESVPQTNGYIHSSGYDISDLVLTTTYAAADGSTKGIASFTAADFNASSGNISLDYTNMQRAAANGTTFGISTYTANDFNVTAGVVSLDFTNAQAASSTDKGFLTSTDWSTFNGKSTITLGTATTVSINGQEQPAKQLIINGTGTGYYVITDD